LIKSESVKWISTETNRLEPSENSDGVDVGSKLRLLKRNFNMRLCSQVINLNTLVITSSHVANNCSETRRICKITSNDLETRNVIDTLAFVFRRVSDESIDVIAFCEEKFGEV
jgi:hypothetical protein